MPLPEVKKCQQELTIQIFKPTIFSFVYVQVTVQRKICIWIAPFPSFFWIYKKNDDLSLTRDAENTIGNIC